MYKKKINYSIQKNIIVFFIMILLITIVFLGTFLFVDRCENDLQFEFVNRSANTNKIFLNLDAMENLLTDYMRITLPEQQSLYLQTVNELSSNLEELGELCKNEQESLNYIRRMNAFNTYQLSILPLLSEKTTAQYDTLIYLRKALKSQKGQAQEFIRSDLKLARDLYNQKYRQFQIQKIYLLMGFVILYICGAVYFIIWSQKTGMILRKMQKNLHMLSNKMWDVEDLESCDFVELNNISSTINQMKYEIQSYIQSMENHAKLQRQLDQEHLENEKKERMLIEAHMAILKSQVNPHFLFNALNIIGKTALLNNPEKAMELIESTAKILRYSLNTANNPVTVQDELDIVKAYLYLQKSRFGESLSFQIIVDDAALKFPIPSMIIQPIVENCFKHGFMHKQKLHITIQAALLTEYLKITVYDNGDGFDTAALQSRIEEGRIGINNVRQRLSLEYHINNPVEIESTIGKYTQVTILIPNKKENIDESINCRR